MGGSVGCVRRLLWAGAEVNAMDEDGWTPLHFAAKEGNLPAFQELLHGQADPNLVNIDNCTPLDVAEAEDKEFADILRAELLSLQHTGDASGLGGGSGIGAAESSHK